ncbi:MAG: hypothetical protein RL222_977 [Bacteroidota bacterium]|jgi:hypothetical protein
MEKTKSNGILSNLIGTPEVKVSLSTKTIVLFFGALVASMALIFLIHAVVKKS